MSVVREKPRGQDRGYRLANPRNRHVTATETAINPVGSHNRHIHPKTVRHRLREVGLRARRPLPRLHLIRARRARRMAWLAAHAPRRFPMRLWRRIFFTDETRFTLFRPGGRLRVYRRRGERFADYCVIERDRFGGLLCYGLREDISLGKVTVDCGRREFNRCKIYG